MSLIFPERCAACGEPIEDGEGLCPVCGRLIIRMSEHTCPHCGRETTYCACDNGKQNFDRCAAPFYYEGVARFAVMRLKYSYGFCAADFFAREMERVFLREYANEGINAVCCVPSTVKTDRKRGCNPGELIAAALAKRIALPLESGALTKVIENRIQHRLPAFERSGNVFGAFEANAGLVRGKRILLVDDIVTTGATASECSLMLKLRGAERVYLIAAAVRRTGETNDIGEF